MKMATLLKLFTILIFVVLIAAFVSYRSGVLPDLISQPIDVITDTIKPGKNQSSDTIPVTDSLASDSLLRSTTMFSTKSALVIPRDHPAFKPRQDSARKKSKKSKKAMMGSSKLGRIFPADSFSIKPKSDTAVEQQQKKQ